MYTLQEVLHTIKSTPVFPLMPSIFLPVNRGFIITLTVNIIIVHILRVFDQGMKHNNG